MKVFLLRLGEIEHGRENRLIGQVDLPLNQIGKDQARWWRNKLERVAFRQIYCSPLIRALHTAEIMASGTSSSITVLPHLREVNLGHWDGLTVAEVKTRFPEEWEQRGLNIHEYRPAGGESFADLSDRVVPVLNQVVNDSEDTVLIVSHAGVNRVILCHVLGISLDGLFRLRQDYGALNIIEHSDALWRVCLMNLKPLSKWALPA